MTPEQTAAVRQLQADLNSWGVQPPLTVDGDPGPKTVAALKAVMAYTASELTKARADATIAQAQAQANKAAGDLLARIRTLLNAP